MSTAFWNKRPQPDEYYQYYDAYVGLVPDDQCSNLLNSQVDEIASFFRLVSPEVANEVHPPYVWTIKQAVGHVIDTERVFGARLHHFGMGDLQALPSMDQNQFVDGCDYDELDLHDLVKEWIHARQANILLIKRIKPAAWLNRGTASGFQVTPRALVWMLVGHVMHHMSVFRGRLKQPNPS